MGQLGIADLPPTDQGFRRLSTGSPCLVDRLKSYKVDQVSCGKDFTIAIVSANAFDSTTGLLNNGFNEVYSWGNNLCGQIGLPSTIEHTTIPIKVKAFDVI
jgi:alpha-tubulin suppressor-like RCC1 family protein